MDTLFLIGLASGTVLLALLLLSRISAFRIWPCPAHWSPTSVSFWALFRLTNVAALCVILLGIAPGLMEQPVRVVAALFGIACLVLYVLSCLELGRENLYCGAAGLKVRGIYRWSRNPQYATAIPGYLAAAVAAGTAEAFVLSALLAAVFFQMAMLEERWLHETYGAHFEAYQARVPRFYNVRRARTSSRSVRRKARSVGRSMGLRRAPVERRRERQRLGQ